MSISTRVQHPCHIGLWDRENNSPVVAGMLGTHLGVFQLIFNRGAKKVAKRQPTSFGSSPGQFYGPRVKNYEAVKRTEVVATQAGLRYIPGPNVTVGRNYTLNAACDGRVLFAKDTESYRKIIAVIPHKENSRLFALEAYPAKSSSFYCT